METILSMLSLNSHSIRAVADQVFKLLIPHLNGKGLQLILDVHVLLTIYSHILTSSRRNSQRNKCCEDFVI